MLCEIGVEFARLLVDTVGAICAICAVGDHDDRGLRAAFNVGGAGRGHFPGYLQTVGNELTAKTIERVNIRYTRTVQYLHTNYLITAGGKRGGRCQI